MRKREMRSNAGEKTLDKIFADSALIVRFICYHVVDNVSSSNTAADRKAEFAAIPGTIR